MLQSISQMLVRAADLAEAEGRVARAEVLRVIKVTFLYGIAAMLTFTGAIAIATGLYLALAEVMHNGAALMTIGAIVLIASAGTVWLGKQRETGG